jgi:Putative ATPase subunit of terminase (gpP-like)
MPLFIRNTMKNHQKQQAYNLYLSSELTNIQIAEEVGVNRRTIMLWAQQGGWKRQRELHHRLPGMLLERSFRLADEFTSGLLDGKSGAIELKHAKTIHYLANGISILNVKDGKFRTGVLRSFTRRLEAPQQTRCA